MVIVPGPRPIQPLLHGPGSDKHRLPHGNITSRFTTYNLDSLLNMIGNNDYVKPFSNLSRMPCHNRDDAQFCLGLPEEFLVVLITMVKHESHLLYG